MILVEVSHGELLDKLSILQIKKTNLKHPERKLNVEKEFELLFEKASELLSIPGIALFYSELIDVNREIWIQMEYIFENRDSSLSQPYQNAVEQSISLNIKRSEIKKAINEMTESKLVEEKSYFNK